MALPWLRIVMIIVMMSNDDVEGVCASVAHVILSWSLRELVACAQNIIVIPKLVAMGRVHPEAWRRTKVPWLGMAFHASLSAATQYGLHRAGRARLGAFLWITAGALPLFKALCYPAVWPIAPFLAGVMYAVWSVDGVRELFVGLALFQGVATAQETRGWYLGSNGAWSFAIWLAAFAAVLPIPIIFAVAYFNSPLFERVIRGRKKPRYERIWWWFERYAYALGYENEEGDDPFSVLGVRRTATTAEIRKRFRDLSLKYHPDKTGNDQAKQELFIKVQKAMEMITKGTFDDSRPDAEQAVKERVFATIHRCGSLSSLIAVWFALSVLSGLAYLGRRARIANDPEEREREMYPNIHIGPSFFGSQVLGFGGNARPARRGVENVNAGGARVVGNRRIATPSGPAPRVDAPTAVAGTPSAETSAAELRRRRPTSSDPALSSSAVTTTTS